MQAFLSSFRPYDLRVVDRRDAGSEHYIFSPSTVLHVTERGCGGLVSLADWYRESVLWTALQEIPFFREFRIRKAFTWYVLVHCAFCLTSVCSCFTHLCFFFNLPGGIKMFAKESLSASVRICRVCCSQPYLSTGKHFFFCQGASQFVNITNVINYNSL